MQFSEGRFFWCSLSFLSGLAWIGNVVMGKALRATRSSDAAWPLTIHLHPEMTDHTDKPVDRHRAPNGDVVMTPSRKRVLTNNFTAFNTLHSINGTTTSELAAGIDD